MRRRESAGPRLGPALTAVTAVLLAVAPAARAERVVTDLGAPSPVRAWAGIAVFSVLDPGTATFRLAVSRHGGPPRLLPVRARASAFDADIGPGAAGGPEIVFSRCADERPALRRGCRLFRFSLRTGRLRRVSTATAPGRSAVSPSIWRRTLAWIDVRDGELFPRPAVMVARPATARPRRLGAVPRTRCFPSGGCRPTRDARVASLDVSGDRVAVDSVYVVSGQIEEVLELVSPGGAVRRVARHGIGLLGGEVRYVGSAFQAGALFWAQTCAECDVRTPLGVFRYDLATGRYAFAPYRHHLTGFAPSGDRGLAVIGDSGDWPTDGCGARPPDCRLVVTDRLAFSPTRSRAGR